jgi:Polyketide cyclase / dehydrase and lipid transport
VKVSSETIIDASADRVWEIVGHQFTRIGEWATAIPTSRPSSQTPSAAGAPAAGRVCETGLPIVPLVEETIVAYDEGGRTLTYTGAGLPHFVKEARNRWTVVAVDDRRARVRVEATIELRAVGLLLAVPFRLWSARVGAKTLDDLKHYVEVGRPSRAKQRQLAQPGPGSADRGRHPPLPPTE